MAAHGTNYPPGQLHCARLVPRTPGTGHLQDGGCWEPAEGFPASPPAQPCPHLYSLVVLGEQQQRLIRQQEAQPLHLLLDPASAPAASGTARSQGQGLAEPPP